MLAKSSSEKLVSIIKSVFLIIFFEAFEYLYIQNLFVCQVINWQHSLVLCDDFSSSVALYPHTFSVLPPVCI
jgi:hypothetical protein